VESREGVALNFHLSVFYCAAASALLLDFLGDGFDLAQVGLLPPSPAGRPAGRRPFPNKRIGTLFEAEIHTDKPGVQRGYQRNPGVAEGLLNRPACHSAQSFASCPVGTASWLEGQLLPEFFGRTGTLCCAAAAKFTPIDQGNLKSLTHVVTNRQSKELTV